MLKNKFISLVLFTSCILSKAFAEPWIDEYVSQSLPDFDPYAQSMEGFRDSPDFFEPYYPTPFNDENNTVSPGPFEAEATNHPDYCDCLPCEPFLDDRVAERFCEPHYPVPANEEDNIVLPYPPSELKSEECDQTSFSECNPCISNIDGNMTEDFCESPCPAPVDNIVELSDFPCQVEIEPFDFPYPPDLDPSVPHIEDFSVVGELCDPCSRTPPEQPIILNVPGELQIEEFDYPFTPDFDPCATRIDFGPAQECCTPTPENKDVVLMPFVRGVVLLGDHKCFSELGWDYISGLEIVGLQLSSKQIWHLKSLLEPLFLNKALTQNSLIKIKHQIISFYQEIHHPLVDVRLPEQDVTDGVLQLIVVESRLGELHMSGSQWFSEDCMRLEIGLAPGALIDTNALTSSVAWLNLNPFRHTDIILAPGKYPGTTDIELVTVDRLPFRMYVGWDNHGTELVGTSRRFAGVTYANLWGLGHTIAYQYTTSLNWESLRAHGAEYIAPIPCSHQTLHVFGGHVEVGDSFHKQHFHHRGQSSQVSVRYRNMCGLTPVSVHEVSFGGDFKSTNNTLLFSDHPVFANKVNLTQFTLGYYYEMQDSIRETTLDLEVFYSPGEWIQHQSNRDYKKLRRGARNTYAYGQFCLENTFFLPCDFGIYCRVQAQGATTNLLPSEQFGLGGYDTVRGYNERVVNGDNALLTNIEIYSPVWSVLGNYCICGGRIFDSMYAVGFMDYGIAHNHKVYSGERTSEYLISGGPGLRYEIGPYLSLCLDWGIQLHRLNRRSNNEDGFRSRIHFSAMGSF